MSSYDGGGDEGYVPPADKSLSLAGGAVLARPSDGPRRPPPQPGEKTCWWAGPGVERWRGSGRGTQRPCGNRGMAGAGPGMCW